jgi:hypothetical protein
MKIKNYNDFYNWTNENDLDYIFESKKTANDRLVVYQKSDPTNWINVAVPGWTGSWENIKDIISEELL